MSKIKIKIITVGHLPAKFDRKKIEKWDSSLFEIQGEIESYTLDGGSDLLYWGFSDQALLGEIPDTFSGDFLLAITNVPLELNWYSRRLGNNKVAFTFHEIYEILHFSNIPIENIVFRVLYAYSLIYKRFGNRVPDDAEVTDFTHDETRGCLFDMNGLKTDVIYSCDEPKICSDCFTRLSREKVSKETITKVQKEIKKIKRPLFYKLSMLIKEHPIWAILISSIYALFIGVVGSVLGTFIFELLKEQAK